MKSQQSANIMTRLTGLRNRAARNAGMDHQPAPLAALPSNDRSLGELPGKRRELFREYLEDSVAKAVESLNATASSADKPVNRSDSGPSDAEQAVMGNGCATCRGSCCEAGGDHAFLNPAEIHRKLDREPGISPTDLVARYISKLPAITFVGSCISIRSPAAHWIEKTGPIPATITTVPASPSCGIASVAAAALVVLLAQCLMSA